MLFMVFPRMRAWVSGLLFIAWLGFLTFLAVKTHGRSIVAGPQVMRSNLVVVATLADAEGRPASKIFVRDVLYAANGDWKRLVGQSLDLNELAFFSAREGWTGPGDYVMPLTRLPARDQITPLPMSPGYLPAAADVVVKVGKTPDALAPILAARTGVPLGRMRGMLDAPALTLVNVNLQTYAEEQKFATDVQQAGGEVISIRRAESRIDRATPDILEQVAEVIRDK